MPARASCCVAFALVVLAPWKAQAAPGPFDGVYTSKELPNGTAQCTSPGVPFVIRVTDSVASMKFYSFQPIDGAVTPDGAVNIFTPRTSLRGKFANAGFDGTLGFGNCAFHLELTRK